MNNTEIEQLADLIWCTLNTIDNQDLNKKEQIDLLKPILNEAVSKSYDHARNYIVNGMMDSLKSLKK